MVPLDEARVQAAIIEALTQVGADVLAGQCATWGLRSGSEPGYRLEHDADGAVRITYGALTDALRAAGSVAGLGPEPGEVAEERRVERLGVMIDMARNAVMRPETVRVWLAHLALLGYTTLYLYLEDVFEVPGHPDIGHGRGRYSQAELREIDHWAAELGIEVVPAVQSLGHLTQVLKLPRYQHLRRTPTVLRVEDPESLELIRAMVSAASAPFRSRRIQIGMDEAFGFADDLPPEQRFGRYTDHIEVVTRLCTELGLEPLMWTDMLFEVDPGHHDFFRHDRGVRPGVLDRLPAELGLVYWDYFHHDAAHYAHKLRQHAPRVPVMAAGCASWGRFWTRVADSTSVCTSAVDGAVAAGSTEMLVTIWGNEGNECDFTSCLPVLARTADRAYGAAHTHQPGYFATVGLTEELWLAAATVDDPFDDTDRHGCVEPPNPSKWLLWLDPLVSFADIGLSEAVVDRMTRLHQRLAVAPTSGLDHRLGFMARYAAVLSLKAQLHLTVGPGHRAGDRGLARELATGLLAELVTAVDELGEAHRQRWLADNKASGWEVLERRYAGLLSRLRSTQRDLLDWADGRLDRIETLEFEPRRVVADDVLPGVPWTVFASPSGMA